MKNIKVILLVLCVAHVALTAAQADEDKLDPYIKVGIGMMSCEKFKNDLVYTGKRPRAAGVFSLGVARNISQSLGIGLDFYYTEIDYRGSSIKQHNTIAGTSATGYYDVGTYKTITPYLAVGAGFARKNSGALVDTSNSARKIYTGTRKTEFTWNVGAGIKFDIDANYILDLGYRFAHLGNLKVGNAVQDNGTVFRGTTQKIRGHQGMFSILYKF
jgi:opacity protein-like surface antigen